MYIDTCRNQIRKCQDLSGWNNFLYINSVNFALYIRNLDPIRQYEKNILKYLKNDI